MIERKRQDCDLDRPERLSLRKPKNASWRGVLGVVVAQLFAIQVLCANIIATQMAFDGLSTVSAICHGGDLPTDGKPSPNGHLQHAACAICTFAAAVPPLPREETRAPALTAGVAIFEYALYRFVGRSDIRTPRSSQGPPQTV